VNLTIKPISALAEVIIGLLLTLKCRQGGDILTRIEKSIEINAPPEKIWPMIQWDRTPEWYTPWTSLS